MSANEELLTAGKLAAKLEASPAKIKKLITELGIEPDKVKGVCKYYGNAAAEKIKNSL